MFHHQPWQSRHHVGLALQRFKLFYTPSTFPEFDKEAFLRWRGTVTVVKALDSGSRTNRGPQLIRSSNSKFR